MFFYHFVLNKIIIACDPIPLLTDLPTLYTKNNKTNDYPLVVASLTSVHKSMNTKGGHQLDPGFILKPKNPRIKK
jgi:glutamate 5-kinase